MPAKYLAQLIGTTPTLAGLPPSSAPSSRRPGSGSMSPTPRSASFWRWAAVRFAAIPVWAHAPQLTLRPHRPADRR